MDKLKDAQKTKPKREIAIDRVGIRGIEIPLKVIDKKNKYQSTVGKVNIYVSLASDQRGTHMSRFLEILYKHTEKTVEIEALDHLMNELLDSLGAENGELELEFPYFIQKKSPVSKKKSIMGYTCKCFRIARRGDKKPDHLLQVRVPITTLCPCSKEISKHGAHNQRGYVTVKIKLNKFIRVEEMIDMIEEESSCEIYPLLKRDDEKFVTEKAYDNPKFVEDIVRDVAFRFQKDKRIDWFSVECENEESIHDHNVYARIEKKLD